MLKTTTCTYTHYTSICTGIKKQIDRYDEQLNTQRLSLTEENEKQRQKLLQEKDHEVSKMRALVDKLQAHVCC